MHTTFKLVLATVTGASLSLLAAPSAVMADDVPDALSVEWQGKKPSEKLFEECSGPHSAMHIPAGSSARVPFPPIFAYLRAERRKGAGAGPKGHTEGRYRYWRVCGRSANSMA